MELNFDALRAFLEWLPQPTLLLKDGAVAYRNPAAAALAVQTGAEAPALPELPAGEFGPAAVMVSLCGKKRPALALPASGGVLLLLEKPEREMSPSTLLCAAKSLREPLTSLFATASTLFPRLEEQEDPGLQRDLASLSRAFYRILRLCGNLEGAGGFLADEEPLYKQKTELGEFFLPLLERVEPLCQTDGIFLDWRLPQKQLQAWISRTWVERSVLNLFSNSMRYTPRGGKIVFSLEQAGRFAVLRIRDDGEGLAPGLLGTAFERYAREPGLEDPRWGAGFGLPIAEKTARAHGGVLLVQPQEEGVAVTMSLSLDKPPESETALRSPVDELDYAGGYPHELVELSDVLPADVYDTRNVD
jgi:hypothetical protein